MSDYSLSKLDVDDSLSIETFSSTHSVWSSVEGINGFVYPWREDTPPKTQFKAFLSDQYIYFLFECDDDLIEEKIEQLKQKKTIDSDRVELFFKKNDAMSPYYALEIDPLLRVLSTSGQYYRQLDFDWQWPKGQLQLGSTIESKQFFVWGRISLSSLKELDLIQQDASQQWLEVGVFRAHYEQDENNQSKPCWISWIKPDSQQPDFHIPSAFGRCSFSFRSL